MTPMKPVQRHAAKIIGDKCEDERIVFECRCIASVFQVGLADAIAAFAEIQRLNGCVAGSETGAPGFIVGHADAERETNHRNT